jgi:hypothetical protein
MRKIFFWGGILYSNSPASEKNISNLKVCAFLKKEFPFYFSKYTKYRNLEERN